jgi:guanylate kinase
LDVLAERLTKRQTETPQDIESRLAVAKVELESQGDYAYTIVNADLAEAQHQLTQILEKELI